MLRVMWRFPLWGPSSSTQQVAAVESWGFPVWAYKVHSTHTVVNDPIDLVESGHKEYRVG